MATRFNEQDSGPESLQGSLCAGLPISGTVPSPAISLICPLPAEGSPVKVSVALVTYNQERFIAQAIESVLAQRTEFPFELVIGEDDSTDATRQICIEYAKKYPETIRLLLWRRTDPARSKYEFPWAHNLVETLKACRGEYIAALEGDDYWTDADKLSTQVRALEEDPQAVICAHRFGVSDEARGVVSEDGLETHFRGQARLTASFENFLQPYVLQTLTVVFRRSALEGFTEKRIENDITLWAHLLSRGGHAIVLNKTMGIYRKHADGAWSPASIRARNIFGFKEAEMLISNEGFSSPEIENTFLWHGRALSDDLKQEALKAVFAQRSHASRVLSLARQRQGFSPLDTLVTWAMYLFRREQMLFLELETESFNSICRSSSGGVLRRVLQKVLLCMWVIAAAPVAVTALPLAALLALHRRLSR